MTPAALGVWPYMALRFVLRHRRKTLATGSFIVLGTAVLVFLQALTAGINDTMVLNTTRLHYGNAFAEVPAGTGGLKDAAAALETIKGVHRALVRRRLPVLAVHGGAAAPAVFYVVDPGREADVTAIARRITAGRYPSAEKREGLIGQGLARQLAVRPGQNVSLMDGAGHSVGVFTVSGIFETGIDYFDNTIGYLPVQAVGGDVLSGCAAEVAVFYTAAGADPPLDEMQRDLPEKAILKTWEQLMPDLVQLIRLNRTSMRIIMVFVFILVGFGISNSFVLTIVERFREFGILKAMGVTSRELVGMIFCESLIVCLAAGLTGLMTGYVLTQLTAVSGIDFSGFTSHNRYFVVSGRVFPRVTASGLYWPALLVVGVSFMSSFLPARIAAKKTAAETLRFS